MKSNLLLISLGSNVGDRLFYLQQAVEQLGNLVGPWLASSSIHETEPWGVDHQDAYLNMVVAFNTILEPLQILAITERLEREAGRTSKSDLKPRTIDIDILILGEIQFKNQVLEIPHPRMRERAFVMEPLRELSDLWNPDVLDSKI
jgi:2-amino-4-hydroxy-6-hydroxymethyldihydropteridine diphosphokinase